MVPVESEGFGLAHGEDADIDDVREGVLVGGLEGISGGKRGLSPRAMPPAKILIILSIRLHVDPLHALRIGIR
ncbi:MAG: hypothetical protein MZV64_71150 [Ignavibacteriales bacterium]|nr:hypothetical protein [Ignavibacteriales bacterium]